MALAVLERVRGIIEEPQRRAQEKKRRWAQGILDGSIPITPETRVDFKNGQISLLHRQLFPYLYFPLFQPDVPFPSINPYPFLQITPRRNELFRRECNKIDRLTDGEVNTWIKCKATQILNPAPLLDTKELKK